MGLFSIRFINESWGLNPLGMVDCTLLDLEEINDEQRSIILRFVTEKKGIKPRDLGITPRYMNMLRHGKARISDSILCKPLEYVTPGELRDLLKG